MTDIVKAPPFMPSKPQWDATVALLERALEELAQAQAERDAAREHAERQQLSKDGLYRELREMSSQRDAARHEWNAADDEAAELRLEVARLRAECNDAQAEAWRAQRRGDTYRQRALCLLAQIDAMLAQGTWYQLLTAAKAAELRAERAEAEVAAVWDALGNYETTGELALRNYIREQLERAAMHKPAPAGGEARP